MYTQTRKYNYHILHFVIAMLILSATTFSCNSQEQNTTLSAADSISANVTAAQSLNNEMGAESPNTLLDSGSQELKAIENKNKGIQVKSDEATTGLSNSFTDEKTTTGSSGMSGYVSASSVPSDKSLLGTMGSGKTKDELTPAGNDGGNLSQTSTWNYNFVNFKMSAKSPKFEADGEGIIKCRVTIACNGTLGLVEYGLSGTTYSGSTANMQLVVDDFLKNASFAKIGDTCPETGLITLKIK